MLFGVGNTSTERSDEYVLFNLTGLPYMFVIDIFNWLYK